MIRQLTTAVLGLVGPEGFDRFRGALVQGFAPFLQQGVVGHFLRQRMLEHILRLEKRRLLVNELSVAQMRKQLLQSVLRLIPRLA